MEGYNDSVWLVEAIACAATDNRWPHVDVKAGEFMRGHSRLIDPGCGTLKAARGLRELSASVSARVVPHKQSGVTTLVDGQSAKLG